MKKINIFIIGMLLLTLMNSSCCLMFSGKKQSVTFKSNASGKVYQNLSVIGNTNEEIKVNRKEMVKLYTIKADGCVDKSFELPVRENPIAWLDVPFAFLGYGLIWSMFDESSGANMKTNKEIKVDLDCKGK